MIFKSGVDEILWRITVQYDLCQCNVFVHQYSKKTNFGCCLISDFTHARDVTKRRNGERGAESGERGAGKGERGTEVWERVVSGNLRKNPKWPVRITNPVRSMIEKRRNNT